MTVYGESYYLYIKHFCVTENSFTFNKLLNSISNLKIYTEKLVHN